VAESRSERACLSGRLKGGSDGVEGNYRGINYTPTITDGARVETASLSQRCAA
jgi:hypothetical protein